MIPKFNDFLKESKDKNEKGDKKEYQAFFKKTLKKYLKDGESVDDGADQLSGADKKKFFDEIDKGWKADKETD